MLASHTYHLIGGPNDGEVRSIRKGATRLAVMVPVLAPDGVGSRLLGEYRVERHPRHGYALVWHEAP